MALLGKQPLTPYHPLYGGGVIFGFKRPDLSVQPRTDGKQSNPPQSDQTTGSEPRLTGNGAPAGSQGSDGSPEEEQ